MSSLRTTTTPNDSAPGTGWNATSTTTDVPGVTTTEVTGSPKTLNCAPVSSIPSTVRLALPLLRIVNASWWT